MSKAAVYVMAYGESMTKIGYSKTPLERCKSIASLTPECVELVATYILNEGDLDEARRLEKMAHDHFWERNAGLNHFAGATEVFNASPAEVCVWLESVGAKRGEWEFPTEKTGSKIAFSLRPDANQADNFLFMMFSGLSTTERAKAYRACLLAGAVLGNQSTAAPSILAESLHAGQTLDNVRALLRGAMPELFTEQ